MKKNMAAAMALAIGLAKNPADRFQTVEELATALRDAARGAMDPSLRMHGARLLRHAPWGARVRSGGPAMEPVRPRITADFEEADQTIVD